MRTTKSVTISLPPEQLKRAERLAKKQSRTMSELFREGLRQLIEREPAMTVCGDAPDATEALKGIRASKPDVVIVDISLALLARLNSQLQLITLAFPIKMLVSLGLLAWLVLVFPKVFSQASGPILRLVHQLLLI